MPPRSMDASASRKRPRDEAPKAKKPAKQEYVGSPGEALLTEEALRSALAHLAEHDDHMALAASSRGRLREAEAALISILS